ncbi:MAG: hypothetical protein RL088_1668 [Verrucomicrobiota bacterium]|jgi:RNA polymerase sigma-70 factor (ECF subfamily)
MSSERRESGPHTHAGFPSTHWSVLAQARGGSSGAGAIETLCRSYWPPVYAELRRRGLAPADAQDATQEFFASLLRRESFGAADAARGRFRAFLLGALDHFLTDRFRASTAWKRGGGAAVLSLDAGECEEWFREQPATAPDAASAFDQRWALVLMDRALECLRAEYERDGRAAIYSALLPFLAAEAGGDGYSEACGKVGMTSDAFAVAVHRLRKRFRQKVREQVELTVSDPGEAEAEMRHLFGG